MSLCDTLPEVNRPDSSKPHRPRVKPDRLAARMNSLTHAVRSEHGLVPLHLADAVAKHHQSLIEFYHPSNDHQAWLLSQVADAAARLDHCQFMIRAELDDMADRADLCWDEDRALAAEEIASRLPKDPSRTAARLRESAHGCRWLLARWNALSVPLAENTPWNEDQCNLAARLMGVGSDLRPSYPSLNPSATADDHAAILDEHVDSIHALMVGAMEPLDAKARELTRLGYPLRPSKEFLRLQRQESKLRKVYNDAMHAFRQARAEDRASSEPITCLVPDPRPASPSLDARNGLPPASEPEPDPEPESESDSPFAGRPVMAMLAALVESANAPMPPRPSTVSLTSAMPKHTITPPNRKARRALEKAARKRQAKAR